jgi:hypothetical protein
MPKRKNNFTIQWKTTIPVFPIVTSFFSENLIFQVVGQNFYTDFIFLLTFLPFFLQFFFKYSFTLQQLSFTIQTTQINFSST